MRETIDGCARAVADLAELGLIAMIEPLPAFRDETGRLRISDDIDLLVEACQTYAAKKKIPLVLRAIPYRTKKVTQIQLVKFYQELGFDWYGELDGNEYMSWSDYRR